MRIAVIISFHEIGSLLDTNTEIDVLYLDFSKAFDSINHAKLLVKLKLYGISGFLWEWFKDYLSNRKQCVVVDGTTSSFTSVISGVPQGSLLGPFLFALYVNDLPDVTSAGTRTVLFVDDTKCYRTQRSSQNHLMLQYDLNGLISWSYDWDLNFNPSKCDVLKISRKRNPAFRNYTIEANALGETNSVKDLGVVISSTLSWHSHVISTVSKCNKILGFLRRNTPNSLGIDLRRALYLSLVRSTLCHGSQVWVPESSTRDLLLLERVQRRASKYILAPGGACFADLSYRDRLIKLDLIPVSYWFEYLDLVFFYKCRDGLFNLDILKYVTPYSKSRVTRNSFISIDYKPNLTKASNFRDSYFNRIVLFWNSLPFNTKESTTLSSFKTKVRSHYKSLLHSAFHPDRMRTFKAICSKCRSVTPATVCCR